MTGRKPPGVSWESWIERQIREGIERGEFDDLEGKGRRLPGLEDPHDELWWVKDKLKREEFVALPPTLAIRKDREDALAAVAVAASEDAVRAIVEAVNQKIRAVNSRATSGPPSTVMPLDLDTVLDRWRSRRTTSS